MTGEEYAVETLGFAAFRADFHVRCETADGFDGRVQPDPVAVPGHQFFHVAGRTALDHPPLGPIVHAEQAVVLEKPDEEDCGHGAHALGRRRPDGRAHRQDVVLDEVIPVVVQRQVFAQREPQCGLVQQGGGLAVEAQYVGQHAVKRRAKQVAALREQAI